MPTTRNRRRRPASRSTSASQQEFEPSEFEVNQCWLIIPASDAPIEMDEGLFDVYVLQDAASMYLFGNVFAPSGSGTAPDEEVDSLLQEAWRAKRDWPQRLLLPDSIPPQSSLAVLPERKGIAVEFVPEIALAIYINDVQAGFREYFGSYEPGAA